MSLVDEARSVRDRIVARLRELEPLVREYEELSRLAAEMGLTDLAPDAEDSSHDDHAPESAAQAGGVRRGPRRDAAGNGELSARVLDAVRSDPGKTVAEYAELLGVPPTLLYRPVRRLTTEGALVKRARQLFASR